MSLLFCNTTVGMLIETLKSLPQDHYVNGNNLHNLIVYMPPKGDDVLELEHANAVGFIDLGREAEYVDF